CHGVLEIMRLESLYSLARTGGAGGESPRAPGTLSVGDLPKDAPWRVDICRNQVRRSAPRITKSAVGPAELAWMGSGTICTGGDRDAACRESSSNSGSTWIEEPGLFARS